MNKNKKYKKPEKRTKNSTTFYLIFKFFANYFWKISENDEEKAKGILRRTHTYRDTHTHTHSHTHIHTYAYSDNCICNAVIIMIIYRIVDDNEPRSRNIIIANN